MILRLHRNVCTNNLKIRYGSVKTSDAVHLRLHRNAFPDKLKIVHGSVKTMRSVFESVDPGVQLSASYLICSYAGKSHIKHIPKSPQKTSDGPATWHYKVYAAMTQRSRTMCTPAVSGSAPRWLTHTPAAKQGCVTTLRIRATHAGSQSSEPRTWLENGKANNWLLNLLNSLLLHLEVTKVPTRNAQVT